MERSFLKVLWEEMEKVVTFLDTMFENSLKEASFGICSGSKGTYN